MRRALHLHRCHAGVWLLLAATLLMRAVLPAGIMAEARGGTIVVGICNSDAKMRIELPARHDGQQQEAKESPCAFAGLAQPALAAPAMQTFAPPPRVPEPRARHPVRPFATAPPRLLPPATGPPLPA